MGLYGYLHRYFAALDVESRLYAAAGGRSFPADLQDLRFDHTELGLRTGFTDKFRARLAGLDREVTLSLSADTVKALAAKADVPGPIARAFAAALAAHAGVPAPAGPAP